MKLVYVPGSLNPGGAETQTVRHVAKLREKGFDVTLILPNGAGRMEGNLLPLVTEQSIPYLSLETYKEKLPALETAFASLKPDVVHSVGYPVPLHAMLAAYKTGVKARIHRLDSCGFDRALCPQSWTYEFAGMKAATHIVGNSQAVIDSIPLYHGYEDVPTRVIPNAVTIPVITKALRIKAREYWEVSESWTAVGLLANFRRDGIKNQAMLIRAAARVVKECPQTVFILCGYKTEYQTTVEREVDKLGVRKNIRFPGRLADLDRLAGWDVSVNCSRTEGFCNALQESMAYGLPVVATRVGGNPELVQAGVTGYLVGDDDDAAMAARLIELIQDAALRQKMGRAGLTWVKKHCSWDTILDQWLELYQE